MKKAIIFLSVFSFFLVAPAFADTIINSDITANTTWTLAGSPYIVTADVSIYGASGQTATLTIEPGVIVKFNANTTLFTGHPTTTTRLGAINAQGTAINPIIFTANTSTPTPGSWEGIYFRNNTNDALSRLDYCLVEYGGQLNNANIYIKATSPTITNCTISNSSSYAITIEYVDGFTASPDLNNNTYLNNNPNGIKIGPRIYRTCTLTKDNAPYIVTAYISVSTPTGVTINFRINPGVEITFAPNAGLDVYHPGSSYVSFDARGTAAEPIRFTSTIPNPTAAEKWKGLRFGRTTLGASTFLDYCIIENAGQGLNGALTVENVPVPFLITNSVFQNNSGSGIYIVNSSPLLLRNNFTNNSSYGINFSNSNSNSITQYSNISANILGGINKIGSGFIRAEYSWWNDASGPSGVGPGTGQSVSANVVFEPWMGEPFNSDLYFFEASISPKIFNQSGGMATIRTKISQDANWTITIKDSINTVVKTFSGTGASIIQDWLGDDNGGQPLPNGTYTYTILIESISAPGTTASLIGQLILNNAIPLAKITTPIPSQFVSNVVQITGTAAGQNFTSYKLEYGVGEFPTAWTQIINSTTPVTNGVLTNWDITGFTQPVYKLRLTVTNAQSQTATDAVIVKALSVYNLADSVDPFSPNGNGVKDTTTFSAGFTYNVNWSLNIKDSSSVIRKTFTGTGTSLSQVWDGKDNASQVLPDDIYSYQIEITEPVSLGTALSAVGQTTIDNTLPMAVITQPPNGEAISGVVTIMGTADDLHFQNYKVEYGVGTSPSTWTIIQNTTTTPVVNGTLATWDAIVRANGDYVLRLTATDTAGNTSILLVPVIVDNIQITNISANPPFINPAVAETSTLSFTLDRPAEVTIELYRSYVVIGALGEGTYYREFIMNLANAEPRPAGVNTLVWNGRDASGNILSYSAYTYVIRAQDTANNRFGIFDPPYVYGSSSISNLSVVPTSYDAFSNEPILINYTLNVPAWVTIGGEYPANFPGFLVEGKPRNSGPNTETWDGRDGNGNIVQGAFTVSMKTELLPQVFTVVQDTTLRIDELRAEGYLIIPSYSQVSRIYYTISRGADVTVRIVDPNGNSWQIAQIPGQSAGAHSVDWDGTDAQGDIVATEGNYRVEMTAQDTTTGTTVMRTANITVFR